MQATSAIQFVYADVRNVDDASGSFKVPEEIYAYDDVSEKCTTGNLNKSLAVAHLSS